MVRVERTFRGSGSELRVVGEVGAGTNNDGIALAAVAVCVVSGIFPGNPLAGAIQRSGEAVDGGGGFPGQVGSLHAGGGKPWAEG